MKRPWAGWIAGTVIGVAVACGDLGAQGRVAVGLSAGAGLVIGESSDLVDGGWSVGGTVAWQIARRPAIAVRVAGSRLALARDRDAVIGTRADNALYVLQAGPELAATVWRLEPFVAGAIGVAANTLSASAAGVATVDETSAAFAWSASAGLRVRLSGGRAPVAVELAAGLVDPGTLAFARVNAAPQRLTDDVAVLALQMGVRLGL